MRDVQSEPANHEIPIDRVGVRDVIYPIKVLDREHGMQQTIAKISLYCNLPHNYRGTHMSRFIEVLNAYLDNITPHNLKNLLSDIKLKLQAEESHVDISFTYFIKKKAPITKAESFMNYEVRFVAELKDKFDFITEVVVPVNTLCPCSKEISERGAHNQRAKILTSVRMKKMVWLEDLIRYAEESASAPLFALLKRPDEKYITEHAYDNPRFVEDVAREVAYKLEQNDNITWYFVQVTSYESIHNHNAFACVKKDKENKNRSRL